MADVIRTAETIYANCLQGVSTWLEKNRNRFLIERYQQLIRVMRGLSKHQREKHFNMQEWGRRTRCGTTMCAAGFCGSDDWFQRHGFVFEPTYPESLAYVVRYGADTSWYAIEAFFGVLPDERHHSMPKHRVFMLPKSVNQVIVAARERIKFLKEQP